MRALLSWLYDYVEWTGSAPELAHVLTEVGLPVPRIERVDRVEAILDVEITSNRGDCMSHLGIAREIGAALGQACRSIVRPEVPRHCDGPPASDLVAVEVEVPDLCPAYCARVFTAVAGDRPTPPWIARRLERLGHRLVHPVVDVTNFVLLARGQPLHAFDRARLRGGRIVVRRSRRGERLELLDGRVRDLPEGILVIADEERPVAVAGVMGGRDTEVRAGTREVVLESARFDPVAVRESAAALGLRTEASARFSRSIDPEECERSSLRAAALIEDATGATVAPSAVRAGPGWVAEPPRRARMRFARAHRLLGGAAIPSEEVAAVLFSLGFVETARDREAIEVSVPSHRRDVAIEEDLVEELARIRGYGRIPVEVGLHVRPVARPREALLRDRVRGVMVAAGFHEALTLPFVAEGLPDDVSPWGDAPAHRVANPVRQEEPLLRRSLLGPLLRSLERNRSRGVSGARLFEQAAVFLPGSAPAERPREVERLAAAIDGTYATLRGAADAVLASLAVTAAWEPAASAPAPLLAAETACARVGGAIVGWVGAIDPRHVESLHLHREAFRAAAFEFDVEALWRAAAADPAVVEPPAHPEVVRDVAVVVPDSAPWAAIESVARSAAGSLLRRVDPFDVYRGRGIPEGQRSIAFRLVLGDASRTLTGAEADACVDAVVRALADAHGAALRGSR